MANKKIKAMFIFEIIGRPPEHVKKTMEELIDKLSELKGIEISNRKIHEPKPVEKEDVKDLFSTFAEVEILGEDLNSIINVVFHAMPSHIEIIEPEELSVKNFDLSQTLSILTTKLHRYDEIAKTLAMERNILMNKLKEIQEVVEKESSKKSKKKNSKKEAKKKRKASKNGK
tara:strand:+ start:939 stop:1454 length:516 start_codon:yes stop_codon:yes gene_type:complete